MTLPIEYLKRNEYFVSLSRIDNAVLKVLNTNGMDIQAIYRIEITVYSGNRACSIAVEKGE
jgi:hypothetical protein